MKKIFTIILLMLMGYFMKAQISVTFSNQVASCNHDGSITATASGGVAPYTYEWYIYNNPIAVSTGAVLSNADPGYYQCVVTDANNLVSNQYWGYITSVVQAYPSNTTPANCPASDGSVTYTVNNGTAPFDYVWSNGQTFLAQSGNTSTITNLAQGQYSVIITDANGCVFGNPDSVAYVWGIAPFTVSVSTTPANCNDGTATATINGSGTAPYTFYWNTTPPQTTATATGINGNTYAPVTVTDADGCMYQTGGSVSYGPSALQVYGSTSNAVCPATNGSINITVTGGTAPYTYSWNTGATTQDLNGLAAGNYSLTVTDNAGCYINVTKHVGQTSTINATVSTTATNCSNNSGSATVSASGGVPPYSYQWYNGATSATVSNLPAGYYGVTVTDANGCHNAYSSYGYVSIPQSCYNGVSGFVYNDLDGNCTVDPTETGLPWQIIDLGNGLYSSTNSNGQFNYNTLTTGTYNISHTPSTGWSLICPTSNYNVTTTAGQFVVGNDFYDQPASLQNDIHLYVYGGVARPGFNHSKYYYISSSGTYAMNGTVEITHDPQEVFMGGSNVISYNAGTRTVTISYNNLLPFSSTAGYLNFYLPATVALGDVLTTTGIAYPLSGDNVPADNYDTSNVTVVGSYDPNIKEVSPAGIGAAGLISPATDHLDYTIHFQNTGTYYAQNVTITDTLDQDLDINTFELLGASHNVTWEISGPRIVKFTFDNIYLPDSLSNEPLSHGLVSYRIKQLPNLSGGTEIKNTAYIYFDYNTPIVTNTTLNTIEIVGIKENVFNSNISIVPNPATNMINVINKNKETCSLIEISDISGRTVASIKTSGTNVQLPELSSGVYILSAHYNDGIYKQKLVISK